MIPGMTAYALARAGRTSTLPLSEVFGPTWQGEGPFAGRRCSFVRLGMCNLSCSWCDTPYTWDHSRYDVAAENPVTEVEVIHRALREHDTRLVVLSGGEPLLHHQRLLPLLSDEWVWHVETNGTIAPPLWWTDRVAHSIVSPKVATDDPYKKRIKPRALRRWGDLAVQGDASFKFVAQTAADVATAVRLVEECGLPRDACWVMPEGVTTDAITTRHRDLAESIMDAGFHTTTRLHVLLWADERGH